METTNLNGERKFYWDALRSPEHLSSRNPQFEFFPMPGSWNGFDVDGKELEANGIATFQIQILLPSLNGILAQG